MAHLATQPVTVSFELSGGPGRRVRIGLIALATDLTIERDFRNMLAGRDVDFFVSRIAVANPMTLDNLRAMTDGITRAASLILPGDRLDVVVFACTSGTAAIGADQVAARIRAARPGIPVSTPATAALVAFEALGVSRIALLTPYLDEVNQQFRAFLEDHRIAVVAMTGFCMESDLDYARIPPRTVAEAAAEADRPDAEAVFLSCTALRGAEVVQSLEDRLGKPVTSSNQALLWDALRQGGYADPIPGYGSLMRM